MLGELEERQVRSLTEYYDEESGGFRHRFDVLKPGKASMASTATCVSGLIATGAWTSSDPWQSRSRELATRLLNSKWESAGLSQNNPFTVAFMLEAVTYLLELGPNPPLDRAERRKEQRAERLLKDAIATNWKCLY